MVERWWTLKQGERGVLIGKTRSGKSTLAHELITCFLRETHGQGRVLVLDSKPRWRVLKKWNGISARYKGWVKGDVLEDSAEYNPRIPLKIQWDHARVLVYSSMDRRSRPVPDFQSRAFMLCRLAFRYANDQRPVLLYFDETSDFVHGLQAITDEKLLQTVRAGGERNLSVLFGTQRPRSIPLSLLTEATVYYIFRIRSEDDRKYLAKYCDELQLRIPEEPYAFFVYRDTAGEPETGTFRLKLERAA